MLSYQRRTLRSFLVLANVLLLAVVLPRVFFFLVFPYFPIRRIVVNGDVAISKDFLYRLLTAEGEKKVSYYQLDQELLRQQLLRYVLIKEVEVEKVYPDTLRIRLQQRLPLLVILLEGEQGSTPMMVDSEGVLFTVGQLPDTNLPVLSGLALRLGEPQRRLPKVLLPFLQQLALLKQDAPEYFRIISEIMVKFTDDGLIADLSLTSYPTQVRSDGYLSAKMMKSALVVLEMLQRGKISAPLIDMRTTGIVYLSGRVL